MLLYKCRMKALDRTRVRLPALLLAVSVAACDEGSPPAEAPAAEPAEAAAASDTAAAADAMEDRFANMFVSEVSHTFDPGLRIGDRFPAIRARFQGEEITGIDRFIRDKGAIFIAARSVDW